MPRKFINFRNNNNIAIAKNGDCVRADDDDDDDDGDPDRHCDAYNSCVDDNDDGSDEGGVP